MLYNSGAVMFEPVPNQHRLSVCCFDQVFKHLQFAAVNGAGFLVLVIDSSVRHLEQFVGERCRICRINVAVLKRNDKVLFQLIVQFALNRIHLDLMIDEDTFRHIKIIQCFHRNRNIRNLLIDLLLCAGTGCVAEDHSG